MTTTPMEEPNGQRVSGAQLYQALYAMDGRMMEQFNALHTRLNAVDERCAGIDARVGAVDGRVTEHVTNHPPAKPSLTRVGGMAGIVATIVTAMVTAIYGLIKRGF